jgi:hypothetical protein
VTLVVWIALGLSGGFVIAAAAIAVVDAVRLWRTVRQFQLQTRNAVADVLHRLAEVEAHTAAAGARAARLQCAQENLHDSLAFARTLVGAVAEMRAAVSRVTALVPSK